MKSINNWIDNIYLGGDEDGDAIDNAAANVTIAAGGGSDTIRNWGSAVTVDGGDGADIISDWDGDGVSISAGAGDDSIYIYSDAGDVTVNTGAGDDTVYAWGSSVVSGHGRTFQVGDGRKRLDLVNLAEVSVSGGDGAEEVIINAPVYSNQASLRSAVFALGKGDDTLHATAARDLFGYAVGDGNDVIVGYGGEDTISIVGGQVDGYHLDGSDVVLNVGSQTITVKDSKNHAIHIVDSAGWSNNVYGNATTTQRDVIKSFVASLKSTSYTDTIAALNEAIVGCSAFTSMADAVDRFIADCRSAGDADIFLERYCGIRLSNTDTGAITGWDAGGTTVKDADSVVPESGAAEYPSETTITKRGFTLTIPTSSSLTSQQRLVIQGLNSWWLEEALKVVEDTYGYNFTDGTAPFNSAELQFTYSGADASFGCPPYYLDSSGHKVYQSSGAVLNINMSKVSFEESDMSGGGLDRTIAHEFTHAIQFANINLDLPGFLTEGLAELPTGADDTREAQMRALIADPDTLAKYVDINHDVTTDIYTYAAGYMFLRYLAKQAADPYIEPAGDGGSDTTTGGGSDTTTGSGSDTTTGSGDDTTTGSGSDTAGGGNDTTTGGGNGTPIVNVVSNAMVTGTADGDSITNSGESVTINAGMGDDTIYNGLYAWNASIVAGAGDDIINNESSGVTITGGTGNDTITGSTNAELYTYTDGDGNDVITNYGSNDTIRRRAVAMT